MWKESGIEFAEHHRKSVAQRLLIELKGVSGGCPVQMLHLTGGKTETRRDPVAFLKAPEPAEVIQS